MSERERFKNWMLHERQYSPNDLMWNGDYYIAPIVQVQWNAWQAAKADSAEREAELVAEVERLQRRWDAAMKVLNESTTRMIEEALSTNPEQESSDE